ncbi:MAG: hypothetical protein Tsb009_02700 [Planctomycetaceae bacterium]
MAAVCFLAFIAFGVCGCGKSTSMTSVPPKTPQSKPVAKTKSPVSTNSDDLAKLFPDDTVAYFLLRDVQKAKREFIQPRYVKDAVAAKKAWTAIINETFKAIRQPGNSYNVSGLTILRFLSEIQSLHVGLFEMPQAGRIPQGIAIVTLSSETGFKTLKTQLGKRLVPKTVGGKQLQIVKGALRIGFHEWSQKTIILGTEESLSKFVDWNENPQRKSLADEKLFLEARQYVGATGELFAYLDYRRFVEEELAKPHLQFSSLAGSLSVDGGFTFHVRTSPAHPLPPFLLRKPRKKSLLKRIPAKTALLISTSYDSPYSQRKEFATWLTAQLSGESNSAFQLIPTGWKDLAQTFAHSKNRSLNEVVQLLNDLWFGIPPVKSEVALFAAPLSGGRWGAAVICDITKSEDAAPIIRRLREIAQHSRLTWQTETIRDVKIQYVDLQQVIRKFSSQDNDGPLKTLIQPKIGYAVHKGLLLIGSIDLLKYCVQPSGKTIEDQLAYDHLDKKNGVLFLIRPGNILNRKFGFAPVDDILKKLAAQIPVDSNYAVTLNSEARGITVRSNIPFTSLAGWLVLEWMGKGPAKLKSP